MSALERVKGEREREDKIERKDTKMGEVITHGVTIHEIVSKSTNP